MTDKTNCDSLRKIHSIPPEYDENSEILILGSFPSVKSRERGFFYAHEQNRFWGVLSAVFDDELPKSVAQKKDFLHRNHIALWDVIGSCDIVGSSDSSIKNVEPNDISFILKNSSVCRIFTNGKKAYSLYNKYILPDTSVSSIYLPSTSPANASWSFDRLCREWQENISAKDNAKDKN